MTPHHKPEFIDGRHEAEGGGVRVLIIEVCYQMVILGKQNEGSSNNQFVRSNLEHPSRKTCKIVILSNLFLLNNPKIHQDGVFWSLYYLSPRRNIKLRDRCTKKS